MPPFRALLVLALLGCKVLGQGDVRSQSAVLLKGDTRPKVTARQEVDLDSSVSCLTFCGLQEKCESFAFNGRRCAIFDQFVEPDQLEASPGWNYFIADKRRRVGFKSITPTTSVPTTTRSQSAATEAPSNVSADPPLPELAAEMGKTGKASRDVARTECKNKHGGKKLLTIHSEEKQRQVEQFLRKRNLKDNIWIGHSLEVTSQQDYKLFWPDKTDTPISLKDPVPYTYWKTGEPSKAETSQPGMQMIANVKDKDFGKWTSHVPWAEFPYVCE